MCRDVGIKYTPHLHGSHLQLPKHCVLECGQVLSCIAVHEQFDWQILGPVEPVQAHELGSSWREEHDSCRSQLQHHLQPHGQCSGDLWPPWL